MERAPNFLDNITLLGPKMRYKQEDDTYEVHSENPNIRQFVWEHVVDLNHILHQLVHVGATVSAKKLQLCQPEIIVVGRKCMYNGQEPDATIVEKVIKWPECRNVSEVRGFLGVAGTVRNWIRGFVKVVTNFIRSYLHHFFDDSHGLKASLKPLRRPFDRCQSCLEAINNG